MKPPSRRAWWPFKRKSTLLRPQNHQVGRIIPSNPAKRPLSPRQRRNRRIIGGFALALAAALGSFAVATRLRRPKMTPVIPAVRVVHETPTAVTLVDNTGRPLVRMNRKPDESATEFQERVEREQRRQEDRSQGVTPNEPYNPQLIPRPAGKIPAYPPEKALEYIQRHHPGIRFDFNNPSKEIAPHSLIEVKWDWKTKDSITGEIVSIPQRTYVYCPSIEGGSVTVEQGGPLTNTQEWAADKAAGQKATTTSLDGFLKSVGGTFVAAYPAFP